MSTKDLRKLKKEIRRLTRGREQLLERFFTKEKLILGSHMETRMRCGTAGCHCHKDGGHPTVRISRWVNGKLKSKIVRIDDRFIYTDSFQDIASAMGASGSGLYSETGYLIGLKEGMTIVADSNHSPLSASIRAERIKAFLRELSRNNPFINWY